MPEAVSALGLQAAASALRQAGQLGTEFRGVLVLPSGEALFRMFEMYPEISANLNHSAAAQDAAMDLSERRPLVSQESIEVLAGHDR